MAKILVIEDDPILADVLQECLEAFQHQVEVANDGLEGYELLRYGGFDLALIDWQLPSLEGPEICQRLRIAGCNMPILMLTQRSTTRDKTSGLDAGADDYLAKPFEAEELAARVRALLRRSSSLFDREKESGRVKMNFADATVTIDGRSIELLKKEFFSFYYKKRSEAVLSNEPT
ncbi:MAG: response regulator transcription factor, partial [Cyanobacteria bacterium]|nr:response regulator transcription factor [Cyanobacteriota bacterium]